VYYLNYTEIWGYKIKENLYLGVRRRYQIFWEMVSLERGLLSLLSTIEELLERNNCCFSLENRDYGHRGAAAMAECHKETLCLQVRRANLVSKLPGA
jgi:hypothetical protein